jgi:A/G-specific adenine glycosylase
MTYCILLLSCLSSSAIQASMIKDVAKTKSDIARLLLTWYKKNKRALPWRETKDPYRIWLSEIMLQQTLVDTVIPYYRRFLDAFPTARALAQAELQDVLKVWENMGYYSRASHLHSAAGIIVEKFGGKIPDTHNELMALPGIGAYTAGAILSIAYGRAVPAVDGNVRRILSRLFAVCKPTDSQEGTLTLQNIASALIPARHPGDFNQALMDLGATVCKTKNPDCLLCPLKNQCLGRKLNLQNTIPMTAKRPPLPHRHAAVAVIRDRDGRFLVVQRPSPGLLASLWMFPGGFIESADRAKADLRKQIKKDLGVVVKVEKYLASVDHAYTHFRLTLHAYACDIVGKTPRRLNGRTWQWLRPEAFGTLPFSKVDRMIAQAVIPLMTFKPF